MTPSDPPAPGATLIEEWLSANDLERPLGIVGAQAMGDLRRRIDALLDAERQRAEALEVEVTNLGLDLCLEKQRAEALQRERDAFAMPLVQAAAEQGDVGVPWRRMLAEAEQRAAEAERERDEAVAGRGYDDETFASALRDSETMRQQRDDFHRERDALQAQVRELREALRNLLMGDGEEVCKAANDALLATPAEAREEQIAQRERDRIVAEFPELGITFNMSTMHWENAALARVEGDVVRATIQRVAQIVSEEYAKELTLARVAAEQFLDRGEGEYAAKVLTRVEAKIRALAATGPSHLATRLRGQGETP